MSTKTKTPKTVTLSASQARVLKAIPEGGIKRKKLDEKIGFSSASAVGSTAAKHSLIGLGLVVRSKDEGDDDMTYSATREGTKVAAVYATNKRITDEDKIPAEVLDPAVKTVHATITYGLELFTKADLAAIRDIVSEDYGDEFDHVDDDSLRRQIANRRKVGAFAVKFSASSLWSKWYREYRQSTHFAKVAAKMVKFHGGDSLNADLEVEDESTLIVVHRRFATKDGECVLGKENPEDLLVLAPETLKKVYRLLPVAPEHDPR